MLYSRSGRKGGKLSAKNKMQQRTNFAAAKDKLVNHVKETYIDPLKSDPDTPKEPRAEFGSWEGKVSKALGLAPSQNENRPMHFETGATEHIPDNVVSMEDFMAKKKGINE
jgi:hypothetical protein